MARIYPGTQQVEAVTAVEIPGREGSKAAAALREDAAVVHSHHCSALEGDGEEGQARPRQKQSEGTMQALASGSEQPSAARASNTPLIADSMSESSRATRQQKERCGTGQAVVSTLLPGGGRSGEKNMLGLLAWGRAELL